MTSAHCPRRGATYYSPTTSVNGPVCRYGIADGQIVVLLPICTERISRRFSPPRPAQSPRPNIHRAPKSSLKPDVLHVARDEALAGRHEARR